MNNRLKLYEQHRFNSLHYQKLLQAKATIAPPQLQSQVKSIRVSPLDRYQFNLTNDKIRKKLIEIYQNPSDTKQKQSKRKTKRTLSASIFAKKERENSIDHQNFNIMKRLVAAESVVGMNWKERQRSLKKYSKLTRKKIERPEDSLFQAFRQIQLESRTKRGRCLRSKPKRSSKSNKQKSVSQSNRTHSLRKTM